MRVINVEKELQSKWNCNKSARKFTQDFSKNPKGTILMAKPNHQFPQLLFLSNRRLLLLLLLLLSLTSFTFFYI